MKTYIYCCLMILCGFGMLNAQTTYTNASFLQEGDVLFTATDNMPNIDIGTPGMDKTWDFMSLSSGQQEMTVVQPASSGTAGNAFPDAEIYIPFGAGELYLKNTATVMEQVGFAGDMAGFNTVTPFIPRGKYRVAPLQYGDTYDDQSGVAFTIPADQIPFIDSLGLPIEPDSIRVTQLFETQAEVDAWGVVRLPNDNMEYDALRVRKTQTTDTKIEVYLPFIGWNDVTDILLDFLGGSIPGGAVPNGTLETYDFIADGVKEVLATVTMDTVGGNPARVTYKVQDTGTAVNAARPDKTVFAGYPNPAFGDVKVDVRGFDSGNYQINLYNMIGRMVQTNDYEINSDSTVVFNVARLPRGTYLYALVDEEGKTLRANRLMVIKP